MRMGAGRWKPPRSLQKVCMLLGPVFYRGPGMLGPQSPLCPPPGSRCFCQSADDGESRMVRLVLQMFHLLSVSLAVDVSDEAHHCRVICKLHNFITSERGNE